MKALFEARRRFAFDGAMRLASERGEQSKITTGSSAPDAPPSANPPRWRSTSASSDGWGSGTNAGCSSQRAVWLEAEEAAGWVAGAETAEGRPGRRRGGGEAEAEEVVVGEHRSAAAWSVDAAALEGAWIGVESDG